MRLSARIPGDHRLLVVAGIVVLLAGLFWGVFAHQMSGSSLTLVPLLDEAWYLDEAGRYQEHGFPGDEPFIMSPGYPLLVAATRAPTIPPTGVLTGSPTLLLALQALAWLACGLLAGFVVNRVGKRWGISPGWALAAGVVALLLVLLYRPMAIYARCVLLEIPLTLLVMSFVALLLADEAPSWRRLAMAGLALGLAASLRAHVLILLVPLIVVGWTVERRPRPRISTLLLAVFLAVLPPGLAALHNSLTTGQPAGPSLNAGLNLYLGQVPESRGLFVTLQGFDLQAGPSGEEYLEHRLGQPIEGPAAADRLWQHESRRVMAAHPGRTLGLWARKVWLHFQGWEPAQIQPLSAWVAEAPVLRLLPVPWWLLVVAGFVGLGAARNMRAARGIFTILILLVMVQSLFFVVSRYRLVLVPLWAMMAGLGMLSIVGNRPWERPVDRFALLGSLVVAVLLTIPWGLDSTQRLWSALADHNLARRELTLAAVEDDGDRRMRVDELLAGVCKQIPAREHPWRLRALNLAAMGQDAEAMNVLSEGVMRAADPVVLEWTRIGLLRQAGRLSEAEALMGSYLQDHPQDADMLHSLAVLQGERHRWEAAASTARRLQENAPHDHRGWLDLGVALARMGRRADAAAAFREGMVRFPSGEAHEQLATNLARLEGS